MSERAIVNVASLPPFAHGPRATIWWGVAGLLAIEGTMFGILIASYFYLSKNFSAWPPLGTPPPELGAATANMVLLLASIWPMRIAHRAAFKSQRRLIWITLAICSVIGFAALALRAFEFRAMRVRWDANAYGSIVWTTLGMHTGHLIASTLENVLIAVLMRAGPVEQKHFVDVNVNAIYWYFVVVAWLPVYVIIYFAPRIL
jgi:heme/copper-type cytochrome/quinol oxidase subunit 3